MMKRNAKRVDLTTLIKTKNYSALPGDIELTVGNEISSPFSPVMVTFASFAVIMSPSSNDPISAVVLSG